MNIFTIVLLTVAAIEVVSALASLYLLRKYRARFAGIALRYLGLDATQRDLSTLKATVAHLENESFDVVSAVPALERKVARLSSAVKAKKTLRLVSGRKSR